MAKFGHNGYSLARKAVNVGKKKNDVMIWFQALLVLELLFSMSAFLVLRIQRNGLKKMLTLSMETLSWINCSEAVPVVVTSVASSCVGSRMWPGAGSILLIKLGDH